MKNINKSVLCLIGIIIVTFGLLLYTHYKIYNTKRQIGKIEYIDSVNTYNKIYYEGTINELKKENKQLYDSLKASKDKIDYLVQFTANQEYHTGKVIVKKETITDTVYIDSLKPSKTFEYTNINPNDTMVYKLKINSQEEPNWYSLDIKTSTKYTIVNKEYENGSNHLTIDGGNNQNSITDVTVFKKDKKSFWKRFSVGPGVTAGYDVVNKQWGVNAGLTISFNLGKQ